MYSFCSDTQYMSATRDYQTFLSSILWMDGNWSGKMKMIVKVQITDDLCGTWVASNGEDFPTKFVIDHIEGDTAYVKYQDAVPECHNMAGVLE